MKFTADRAQFTKEISKFIPFVERKTTIPILANLLIVANKESLTITATDLDVSLVSQFKAKVEAKGSISVPARRLADTLKKMSTLEDTTIAILVTDNWVHLSCGDFTTKLIGVDAKNFPTLPKQPEGGTEIPADVLATLISKTRFAISDEESRYTLNGALLIVAPESIAMVATDGHRLAHIERNASKFAVTETQETIVKSETLDNLKPFLTGTVTFTKTAESQFFSVGSYTIIARPVIGKYPNWQAVLPKDNGKNVTVHNKQFAAALGRVSQFANERSKACKFELVPDKGLQISASSSEEGEASELVKAAVGEDSVTVGLNAEYVTDVLKAMGEPVTMKLRDAQSSVLFVPATASEYKFQVVVMPVRL